MRRVGRIVFALGVAGLGAAAVGQKPLPQTSAFSLVLKAQRLLESGKPAEALRAAGQAIAKEPKRVDARRIAGLANFELDRPDAAEKVWNEALKLAPDPIKPGITADLQRIPALRQALRALERAEKAKAAGDIAGATVLQERAYRALPSRYAYGIAAAELYEKANRLEDARGVLEDVRKEHPTAVAATSVAQRIASLEPKLEEERRKAEDARAAKIAEENRLAEEKRVAAEKKEKEEARRAEEERQRIEAQREAERRAQEEREREEKARRIQQEVDRLTGILNGYRSEVYDAENALRLAQSQVDDAQRAVDRYDREADSARGRRDRARQERDDLQRKVDDAKGSLEKQIAQNNLRGAENAYNDAKAEYDRANGRLNDARSRLSQAQSSVSSAQSRLTNAEQNVRNTEAEIQRVSNS